MNPVIDNVRREASNLLDSQRRSELGQYMTPSKIAAFMASLFTYKGQARLLDAGAGVGSLTSAFFDPALQNGTAVDAETWEIDNTLGGYLKNTLDEYVQHGQGKIRLGIKVGSNGKMPDVVIYFREKNWLVLIEAVVSSGPVDGIRHAELSELFKESTAGLVYVTAFPDRGEVMRKFLSVVAWETEVWCASAPTHLIHFNGIRFLGPYANS